MTGYSGTTQLILTKKAKLQIFLYNIFQIVENPFSSFGGEAGTKFCPYMYFISLKTPLHFSNSPIPKLLSLSHSRIFLSLSSISHLLKNFFKFWLPLSNFYENVLALYFCTNSKIPPELFCFKENWRGKKSYCTIHLNNF